MAFAEALKPKAGSKHLRTIINAEGKEVEVERRVDEEQNVKYKEIIDTLIGAGYYRAKILALSEFDKVVGGMVWCIHMCEMDLDVDLLFQENSTIGQKIALTEKIVAVLPKMNCPHSIEPHQIQGLDFIHIHPVIEWLVKKSLENREERGDVLRLYAVKQFDKYFLNHTFPREKLDENLVQRMLLNIKNVQDKYYPQRKFRRTGDLPSDIMSRVQSTLFEYGYAPLKEDEETAEGEGWKGEVIDEVRLEKLTTSMTPVQQNVPLAGDKLTSLLSKCAEEVREAEKNYNIKKSEYEKGGMSELRKLQEKEQSLLVQKEQLETELKAATESLERVREKNCTSLSIEHLSEEEQGLVKQMETMLMIGESLKEQEQLFREQCKTELANLQALIKEAEMDSATVEGEKSVSELNTEIADARMRLAKATRAVAIVNRLLDQVPSRAELTQYRHRFMELYNQVSSKHRETKQYYTLYNTLNDTHQYLNKELNLLNSILDNYNEAMSSPAKKDEFMKQFEHIVDGIKHNKAKVEQRRNDLRDMRDKYKGQLQQLVEQQRLCSAALKQFTDECKTNEILLSKLKRTSHNSAENAS